MSKKKQYACSRWAWSLEREADIDPVITWRCEYKTQTRGNAMKERDVVFWEQRIKEAHLDWGGEGKDNLPWGIDPWLEMWRTMGPWQGINHSKLRPVVFNGLAKARLVVLVCKQSRVKTYTLQEPTYETFSKVICTFWASIWWSVKWEWWTKMTFLKMWSADLLQQKIHEKWVTCEKYKFLYLTSYLLDQSILGYNSCTSSYLEKN